MIMQDTVFEDSPVRGAKFSLTSEVLMITLLALLIVVN
jgi:hypothetical protein